jgi:hypothetical protein
MGTNRGVFNAFIAKTTDEVNQSSQTLFWKAAMEIGVS